MALIEKSVQVEASVDAAMQDVLLVVQTVKGLYASGKPPGVAEIVAAALLVVPRLGASLSALSSLPADVKADPSGSVEAVAVMIPQLLAALKA